MSDNEFNAAEWGRLGVAERVGHCQIMNNEALVLAEKADPEEASAYRFLARAWVKLADAISHEALGASNTERENLALADNLPLPVQSDDATKGLPDEFAVLSSRIAKAVPDNMPIAKLSDSDTTKALPDNVSMPEPRSEREETIRPCW